MDTWLQLRIRVPDDALVGEVDLIMWRSTGEEWDSSLTLHRGVNILPTMQESGSPQAWAVTALRDTADRCVANLIADISAGEEKPMVKAIGQWKQ